MELKVWSEGIPRIISGIQEDTTCHDIVLALAHATQTTGSFTLIECWRHNERLIAPSEKPVELLRQWGEHARDLQFILRHSNSRQKSKHNSRFTHNFSPHAAQPLRRSLTFSGAHSPVSSSPQRNGTNDNCSVESYEDQSSLTSLSSRSSFSPYASLEQRIKDGRMVNPPPPRASSSPYSSLERQVKHNKTPYLLVNQSKTSPVRTSGNKTHSLSNHTTGKSNGILPHSIANRSTRDPYLQKGFPTTSQTSTLDRKAQPVNSNGLDVQVPKSHTHTQSKNHNLAGQIKSQGGSLVTRPKVPDALGHSDLVTQENKTETNDNSSLTKTSIHFNGNLGNNGIDEDSRKSELLLLIQEQEDKLTKQKQDLSHFEKEIEVLELEDSEMSAHLENLTVKTQEVEQTLEAADDELETLELVSWEDQLLLEERANERIKREIDLLKQKINEKNEEMGKVKLREEQLSKTLTGVAEEENKFKETTLQEISVLQAGIEEELGKGENRQEEFNKVDAEVKKLETMIQERIMTMTDLERELESANLVDFLTTPPSSPRALDGQDQEPTFGHFSLPRSVSRKLMHSPQHLKNAVATPKNPHGLWV